jgi:hypothetical protein
MVVEQAIWAICSAESMPIVPIIPRKSRLDLLERTSVLGRRWANTQRSKRPDTLEKQGDWHDGGRV